MKRLLVTSVLFLCCSLPTTKRPADREISDPKYQLNLNGYKGTPSTLPECFIALDSMLHTDLKKEIECGKIEDMNKYHHGLGMWIRNNWGLWGHSKLRDTLVALGLMHPDDMSALILNGYYCRLRGAEYDIEKHIVTHKHYWKIMDSIQNTQEYKRRVSSKGGYAFPKPLFDSLMSELQNVGCK